MTPLKLTNTSEGHDFQVHAPEHGSQRGWPWARVAASLSQRARMNRVLQGLDLSCAIFWSNGWQTNVFALRIANSDRLTLHQMLSLSAYTVQHAYRYDVATGTQTPRIHKLQALEWCVEESAWIAYYAEDPHFTNAHRQLGAIYPRRRPYTTNTYMDRLCWQGPEVWS